MSFAGRAIIAAVLLPMLALLVPGCTASRAWQLNCGTIQAPGDASTRDLRTLRNRLHCDDPKHNAEVCRWLDLFAASDILRPEYLGRGVRLVGLWATGTTPDIRGETPAHTERGLAVFDYVTGDRAKALGGDGSLPVVSFGPVDPGALGVGALDEVVATMDRTQDLEIIDNALVQRLWSDDLSKTRYNEVCGTTHWSSGLFDKGNMPTHYARVADTEQRELIILPTAPLWSDGPIDEIMMFMFPLGAADQGRP
jgi:hypothetical protein